MPSQIIFLFDLDQCLPLCKSLSIEDLERQMSLVKHVCLKILTSSSSVEGAERGAANLAHFGFRFYSSTEYFLVPQDLDSAHFYELSEDNFSLLEGAISDRFERLWQSSKSNIFNSDALQQHIQKGEHKPHAQSLRKALEEIAVLFNWDRPMLNSPVKREGSRQPNENVIYILTCLPNSLVQLNQFLGVTCSRIQHNIIYDEIFNPVNAASGGARFNMLNVFKGETNIKIAVIDTSTLCPNETHNFDKRVKQAFHKCFRTFRGGVIPIESFQPDVKESAMSSVSSHSSRVSTLISEFLSEESERKSKIGSKKQGALRLEASDSTTSVNLNFEPIGSYQPDFISPKMSASIRCLVSDDLFPVDQQFDGHFSVWPATDQPSWSCFFGTMRKSHQKLLITVGIDRVGVITPLHDESGILSLLCPEDSLSCLLLTKSNEFSDGLYLPQSLSDDIDKIVKSESTNFSLNKQKPSFEKSEEMPFQAECFETWKVPESKPFCEIIQQLKEKKKQTRASVLRELQKSYLPPRVNNLMEKRLGSQVIEAEIGFSRKASEESLASHISTRSNPDGGKKYLSRGAELMRLGSKNAELRRHSSEESSAASKTVTGANAQSCGSDFQMEKEMAKTRYEQEVSDALKSDSTELICKKLMELQWKLLHQVGHCSHAEQVALAEVTVGSLLKHSQESSKNKTCLENLVEENFLVDPVIIGKRKTSKVLDGRIKDHKLQVLYRMEMHWFLASQEKQTEIEQQILLHLRQISIWDSPEEMRLFLQDVVTPSFHLRQPELINLIYEELNLPQPGCIRDLFSPAQKSDCSSIQPSSINSELSRSNLTTAFDLSSRAAQGISRQLRRMSSFDSKKLLQISVGAADNKKKVGAAAQNIAVKKAAGTPQKKSTRRNLTFDHAEVRRSPRKKSGLKPSSKSRTPRKTPRKNVKTPVKIQRTPHKTPKKSSRTPRKVSASPKLFDDTPAKRFSSTTPYKMTPGKKHRLLAPETPSAKNGARTKTDGTTSVLESPDIDALKQNRTTTPRRVAASLHVQRKTSFYSGSVSRNLVKAEEMLHASKIQVKSTRNSDSQSLVTASKREVDSGDDSLNASIRFFPHMVKKSKQSPTSPELDSEVNFKISDLVNNDRKMGVDNPDLKKPLRRLFSEDDEAETKRTLRSSFNKTPQKLSDGSLFNGAVATLPKSDPQTPSKVQQFASPSRNAIKCLSFNEKTVELMTTTPRKSCRTRTPVKVFPEVARSSPIKARTPTKLFKSPEKSDVNLFSPRKSSRIKTPAKDSNKKQSEQSPAKTGPPETEAKLLTPRKSTRIRSPVKNLLKDDPSKVSPLLNIETASSAFSEAPKNKPVQAAGDASEVSSENPVRNEATNVVSPQRKRKTMSTARSRSMLERSSTLSAINVFETKDRDEISTKKTSSTVNILSDDQSRGFATAESDVTVTPAKSALPVATERPSRRKSQTCRFGIDDIRLTDAFISPASKSGRLTKRKDSLSETVGTPVSRYATPVADETLAAATCSNETFSSEKRLTPKVDLFSAKEVSSCDKKIDDTVSAKKRKRTASSTETSPKKLIRLNILSPEGKKRLGRAIDQEDSPLMQIGTAPAVSKTRTPKRLRSRSKQPQAKSEEPKVRINFCNGPPAIRDTAYPCATDVESRNFSEPVRYEQSWTNPRVSSKEMGKELTSPAKGWMIVDTTESPRGEIKMRFNRHKKPEQPRPLAVQRISRRMTTDIGLSPEELMKICTGSPSPKKRKIYDEKENDTKASSNSSTPKSCQILLRKVDSNLLSAEKKFKFSPLSSQSLINLTTSPIVDKQDQKLIHRPRQKKVNKRLYCDDLDRQ